MIPTQLRHPFLLPHDHFHDFGRTFAHVKAVQGFCHRGGCQKVGVFFPVKPSEINHIVHVDINRESIAVMKFKPHMMFQNVVYVVLLTRKYEEWIARRAFHHHALVRF